MIPTISGRVFLDGRPVDRIFEVRLEGDDAALIATAYTFGSPRFAFSNVYLQLNRTYFLAILDPGCKELRYRMQNSDFVRDSSDEDVYHFTGLILLEVESLPPKEKAHEDQTGSRKTVHIRQLMAAIPDKARREYDRALKDIAAHKKESALKRLEKAIELAPEYYDALNKLGAQYIEMGRFREAEAVLQRAHQLNPNDTLPLINLGALHFKEGEELASAAGGDADTRFKASEASYLKAVNMLEEALRLDPADPRANFFLGTALYRIGSYERAESLLMNALALDIKMHEARLSLLNIYIRHRRYDDALKQISLYLQANPDTPEREQMEALRAQIKTANAVGR